VSVYDLTIPTKQPNTTTERTTPGWCFSNCVDFPGCTAFVFETTKRKCKIYTGFINATDSTHVVRATSTTTYIFDCNGMSLFNKLELFTIKKYLSKIAFIYSYLPVELIPLFSKKERT